jgi:enoyl-CoA hydratase
MSGSESPHRLRVELPAPGPDGPVASVALITLDRPEVLNALDAETMRQLAETLEGLDADDGCRAIVITGAGERAFAAGADIRELAMACDLLIAADDAVFGQPEIKLGVIPGAGGTQRLTRALGKAKAMEVILTGRNVSAREAEAHGLITQLVPREAVVPSALELAARIAAMPPLAVMAAKEAVNRAFELSLEAGLEFERRNFFLLFGSEDQREGMAAFVEKREPEFKGR